MPREHISAICVPSGAKGDDGNDDDDCLPRRHVSVACVPSGAEGNDVDLVVDRDDDVDHDDDDDDSMLP